MKTVTYKGPTDPSDFTTEYVIGDHGMPVDEPVDVPDEVAAQCKATEGHTFEISTSSEKSKEPAKGKKQEA